MKKLISLIKATMSQDMDLFKNTKTKHQATKKIFPIVIALLVMLSVGSYAFLLGDELSKVNLTYVLLTLFMMLSVIVTTFEGIYKSQGILFASKDNDLLLSLPIEKSKILFTRLLKLIVFQFIYNALFMVPAIITYATFEKPGISYYLISIIMLILLPVLPTIVGSIIGYIVTAVSSKFKAKKLVQTIFTFTAITLLLIASFNVQTIMGKIVGDAANINNSITKIYYPAELYTKLIQNFNIIDLLLLIAVNIIPLVLFIYIASISYFKILSKESEGSSISSNNKKISNKSYKAKKPIKALIDKELKRFFSSPVYMYNAGFGLVLILIITIGISVDLKGIVNMVTKGHVDMIGMDVILKYLPIMYQGLIMFTASMTAITASSISLEGKSFNITKSLPIGVDTILKSKILTSLILTIPLLLVSEIIFFIVFKVDALNILYIVLESILVPIFTAILGIIINLNYPKMDATSDTEVVKQSTSTMISVFFGFLVSILKIIMIIVAIAKNIINIYLPLEIVAFIIITIVLALILKKIGTKKFNEINV